VESSFRIGLDGISHQAAKPERMGSSFRIGLDGISHQAAKPKRMESSFRSGLDLIRRYLTPGGEADDAGA